MSRWVEATNKEGSTPPKSEKPATWNDGLADAMPKRAAFFDAMRTNPYLNHNLVQNYVEFWAAFKVDAANDKWRVMHYMIHDLDKKEGSFVAETAVKDKETGAGKDVSFAEAVAHLVNAERVANAMPSSADFDMEKFYPAAEYPELRVHFYDLEYFKKVANIEGIAFDEFGQPYRRVEGRIFADATFKRTEVAKSILAAEQARDNPHVLAKIEGGIVSDIFCAVADRNASLDSILRMGQCLSLTDTFADMVGGLYLTVQAAVGVQYGYDRVSGLGPDEKAKGLRRAQGYTAGLTARNFKEPAEGIIALMEKKVSELQKNGVHTEPFSKFVAECSLFINLLYANRNLVELEEGFKTASNIKISMITEIRQSVDEAQRKFMDLGGTQEEMDKLKAWIALHSRKETDPKAAEALKDKMVPPWLANWLTRYYTARGNIVNKVQERKDRVRQAQLVGLEVKPPVTDAYNGPQAQPRAEAQNSEKHESENPQALEEADFEKFKKLTEPRPKKPAL